MYQKLKEFGKVKIQESLSKHTSLKIGGLADFFIIVENNENLVNLLRFLDGEGTQYFILGGGTNLLITEEGVKGVVIKIQTAQCKILNDVVVADAGCVTARVAQESIKAGLTGFEWAIGIPGSIGGAVRGNAGSMGSEMKDNISKVVVYRNGEVLELSNIECDFDYRESVFKTNTDVVLSVELKLQKSENKELAKKAMENLKYRNETQPKGSSCGCIFKNLKLKVLDTKFSAELPEQFIARGFLPAGWLIEQSGIKGRQIGGAQVNEKHANFILNDGSAKAEDYLELIAEIKDKVYNKFKIELEEEIKILK